MAEKQQRAALPFEDLIAAPLVSAAKASAELARTTSDFIEEVGRSDPLRFTFERHRDEYDDERGVSFVAAEQVALSLPVLGAVSIPNLRIERININFSLEVRGITHDESVEDTGALPKSRDAGEASAQLVGRPSAHREHTRDTDSFAKYTFDLVAVDGGVPEGLARILDLYAQSVAPVVVAPAATTAPTDPAAVASPDDGLEQLSSRQLNARIDEINDEQPGERRLSKSGTKAVRVRRIREALGR